MNDNAKDVSVFMLREHRKSHFFITYFSCLFCDVTFLCFYPVTSPFLWFDVRVLIIIPYFLT